MSNLRKQTVRNFELDPTREADQVPVSAEALKRLGWTRVVATQFVADPDLHFLLNELQASECSHTWSWVNAKQEEGIFIRLQKFEAERRETTLLFYYGERANGSREFFGTGAIADRLSLKIPFSGFPVVGRYYILNKYRENRFFSSLLNYQISTCVRRFGADLKGVHIGTSNPRVAASLRGGYLGSPYHYLGNEALEGQDNLIVKAFVLLTESFRDQIAETAAKLPESDVFREFKRLVARFIRNETDETFSFKLNLLTSRLERENGLTPLPIKQLLDLMSSIPVIQQESHGPAEEPIVLLRSARHKASS